MDLLLLDYSNISKIIAPIGRSDLVRYLQSIVRPHVVRRAAAGVDDVAPVSPCQTVSPVLLHLTVSHPLAQPHELLSHLDVLDGPQVVPTSPIQHQWHGVFT